ELARACLRHRIDPRRGRPACLARRRCRQHRCAGLCCLAGRAQGERTGRIRALVPAARAGDQLRVPQCRRPAHPLLRGSRRRQRSQGDPELLQQHRQARAAAGELERWRLRPAGAALPRPAPWRGGRQVLGPGRRRPRVQVEQLHRPLPHAPPGPDGPAGDVPAARQRPAGRDGQAVRLSRQAGHGRRPGVSGLPGGQAGGHPPLLRDRRDEHLPAVLPLPEDARRADRGRVRPGDRPGQGDPRRAQPRRAALAGVPGGLGL
ncbi:MAG: Polysaccharide biosynthesis protein WlaX, partial [uncultured Ramlibacter sp.]